MRRMPTTIHGVHGEAIEIPAIPRTEWDAKLAEIAGRDLTIDEQERADKMANHNWTLRIVADALFGDEVVDAYFAAHLEKLLAERKDD